MTPFIMPEPRATAVVGFHGTSASQAQIILHRQTFQASTGAGEWLGHGVYFWTTSSMAWWWAMRKSPKSPAVLQATLVLGVCLDCTDMASFEALLQLARDHVSAECKRKGVALPSNNGDQWELDCAVLNAAHGLCMPPFDSVMAPFVQGDAVYEGSSLKTRSHIQICMKSPHRIFDPHLVPNEEQ